MKIAILICLVASYVCVAQAFLKCNKCEGEPGGDCANGVASAMKQVECTEQGLEAQCFENDLRSGTTRSYSRGCTKRSNPDLCTLLYTLAAQNPMGLKVFSCSLCDTEVCN